MIGRILITGGPAFIGSRAAAGTRGMGGQGCSTPCSSRPRRRNRPRSARCAGPSRSSSATADARTCWRALAGCSHALHLAAETGTGQSAYSTARYADANVLGTAALPDLRRRSRAFAHAGNAADRTGIGLWRDRARAGAARARRLSHLGAPRRGATLPPGRFGLGDTFNVLYAGVLGHKHDITPFFTLARACRDLADLRIVIVGSGFGVERLRRAREAEGWPTWP